MLDRRHVRRQGSRSYTPLLLYVFPVLHQIRLSVDTPTQDPSLGVEASCFALPRGAVETPSAKHAEWHPRFGVVQPRPRIRLFSTSKSRQIRFSFAQVTNFSLRYNKVKRPRLPRRFALPRFACFQARNPGAEDPSRSLGIAVLTSDFMRRGRRARKPAERACRIHEDSERRSGAFRTDPRGQFCVGERSMNAPFFTHPPQIQAILGS